MANYTKAKLSESVDGKPVKVVAISSPGTTIHTAVSGTTSFDEIWLWAYNGHTSAVTLTIEYGGSDVPDQNIVLTLASKSGLVPITPGLILQNGLSVKAFASTANVVTLSGFVNSITD